MTNSSSNMDRQLIVAAENGRTEEIKRLLEMPAAANANGRSNGTGATGAATANVNAKDIGGWSALHWATTTGQVESARLLLDHGASVNTKTNLGWTPLHYASNSGRVSIACLLMGKGANMHAKDNEGKTPLDVANNEHTAKALKSLQEKWKTLATSSNSKAAAAAEEKKDMDTLSNSESLYGDDNDNKDAAAEDAATSSSSTHRLQKLISAQSETHNAQMVDLERKSISTITNLQAFIEQQNKQTKVAQMKMTNLIQEQTERQFHEMKLLEEKNKNINEKVEQLLLAQQQQAGGSTRSLLSYNGKTDEVLKSLQGLIMDQTKTIQALEKKLIMKRHNTTGSGRSLNSSSGNAKEENAQEQEQVQIEADVPIKYADLTEEQRSRLLLEKLDAFLETQGDVLNDNNSTNSAETPVTGPIHAKLEKLLEKQDLLLTSLHGKALGMEFLQVSLAHCQQVGEEQQQEILCKKAEIDFLQAQVHQYEEKEQKERLIAENALLKEKLLKFEQANCEQNSVTSLQQQVEAQKKELAALRKAGGGNGHSSAAAATANKTPMKSRIAGHWKASKAV